MIAFEPSMTSKPYITKSRKFGKYYVSKGKTKYNIFGSYSIIHFDSFSLKYSVPVSDSFLLELILKHNLTNREFLKGAGLLKPFIPINDNTISFVAFVEEYIDNDEVIVRCGSKL